MAEKRRKSLVNRKIFNTSKGYFGQPLDHEVPIIVCDCMAFIRNRAMFDTGILNIPGNTRRVKELKEQYDKEFCSRHEKENNPTSILNNGNFSGKDVSSLLKSFFSELPGGLIPKENANRLMQYAHSNSSDEALIKLISHEMKLISSPNRECLSFLISYLREIAAFRKFNGMTADNIAASMAMCIMSGVDRMSQLQNLGFGALIVKKMITLPVKLYMPSLRNIKKNTRFKESDEPRLMRLKSDISVVPKSIQRSGSYRGDCFLAHEWSALVGKKQRRTHDVVKEISQSLKENNLAVWFDANDVREDIDVDILNGLRNTDCFVIFLTRAYMERSNDVNANSTKEFRNIVSRGLEKIVLVVLDPDILDTSTWCDYVAGFHLGRRLYIDFSTEKKMKENMVALVAAINNVLSKA